MSLSQTQKKKYRAIGHKLNPIVTLGDKGLSETVAAEIVRALNDHELIKIKIVAEDREDKKLLLAAVIEHTQATLVQSIGHVALLLKKGSKPNPKLSNIKRFENLL